MDPNSDKSPEIKAKEVMEAKQESVEDSNPFKQIWEVVSVII